MHINPRRLNDARNAAGLTLRRAAREAGVTAAMIGRLEETGDARHVPLGTLGRIADTVGVPLAALLTESDGDADTGAADVGSVLFQTRDGVDVDVLVRHVGSDRDDVVAHVAALRDTLVRCGIGVAHADNRVRLYPLRPFDTDTLTTSSETAGRRRDLTSSDASVVWRVMHGGTLQQLRTRADTHLRTGHMIGAGILHETNGSVTVSPATAYSLGFGPTPSPNTDGTTTHGRTKTGEGTDPSSPPRRRVTGCL